MPPDIVKCPLGGKIVLPVENRDSSIMFGTSTWSTVAFIVKGEVGISKEVK